MTNLAWESLDFRCLQPCQETRARNLFFVNYLTWSEPQHNGLYDMPTKTGKKVSIVIYGIFFKSLYCQTPQRKTSQVQFVLALPGIARTGEPLIEMESPSSDSFSICICFVNTGKSEVEKIGEELGLLVEQVGK